MDDVSFWLVVVAVIVFVGYAVLIEYYRKGWQRLAEYKAPADITPSAKVSIIIPARNEENTIGRCLQSIVNQRYPPELLQVIVIDDHSTDRTADIVTGFNNESIQLIALKDHVHDAINSYKKKAITTGVERATGDWILTTDADCEAGRDWISTLMAYQQETEAVLIAAPVKLQARNNLLGIFQSLDFLSLQGVTAASVSRRFHSMGNGANLCYSKEAFHAVNGFEGIDHIASGDDMLLMFKIAQQYPGKIHYLKSKDAIVTAKAADGWRAFWQQRIRWASKADKYEDKRVTRVLLLVYLLNILMLTLFVLSFFNPDLLLIVILFLFSKILLEFPFVNAVSSFFGERRLMKFFPLLQPLHIVYTVIAGWLGKFGRYQWKGRTVQ
ncbi:MAG TPA: glycosyltransferase [Chitinophagaceae bacterium]|nr:glycosyltransferase [Chitinophagaceae bacterium]